MLMNNNLKSLIIKFGFLFMPLLALCSCEDEPRPQHEIRVVVECDAYSNVDIYGLEQGGLIFNHKFDYTITDKLDKGFFYDITAFCEDPQTVMKVTVYVDGEYSGEVEGHSRVYIKLLADGTLIKGPDYLLTDKDSNTDEAK